MKKLLLFIALLNFANSAFSQSKYDERDYAKRPVWIAMMNDEQVNYFEIQKAFEAYWETHQKPEGEGDMDVKEVEKNKKRFSKKELRLAREEAKMRVQIRKYKVWLRKMEPFVKDDGSLMTPEERRNIYKN